jgi:hypothetical protein
LLAEFDKKESFFGKSVKDKVMSNLKGILATKLETEDFDLVQSYHSYLSKMFGYNIGFADLKHDQSEELVAV